MAVMVALAGCLRQPVSSENFSRTARPEPTERTADFLPAPHENSVWGAVEDPRLPFPVNAGEYILGPPPPIPPSGNSQLSEDAADSLHNLVLAPEDVENGWTWAWGIFQAMPPELRPAFIDQVASVTPAWAWGRLDPILFQPGWGPDVLNLLYQRMLDLPLFEQLPRLLLLAKNPAHPCHERARGLLQSYFPEVRPGQYEEYQLRIDAYRAP